MRRRAESLSRVVQHPVQSFDTKTKLDMSLSVRSRIDEIKIIVHEDKEGPGQARVKHGCPWLTLASASLV